METQSTKLVIMTALVLLIIFVFMASSLLKRKNHGRRGRKQQLPPGPWKLPLIGNLHQLAGESIPCRAFRDLARKHGPIMHFQIGEISSVIVSTPRLAKEVMKTHDLALADRPELLASEIMFYNKRDVAFAPYGDYWRQMRKVCVLELLSYKNVRSFGSMREQEVSDVITWIHSFSIGSAVDLSEKFSSISTAITCRASFGEKFDGQDELIDIVKEQIEFLGAVVVADIFPSMKLLQWVVGTKRKLQRMQRKVDFCMDKMIHEHRQKYLLMSMKGRRNSGEQSTILQNTAGEYLVDVLIRLQQSGNLEFQMADTNIKSIIFEMFAAGTDTSSTVVDWAFSELMKNPRVMHKVQTEVRLVVGENNTIQEADIERLSYLKLVIKETMRLHPPSPLLIPRQCREACEIDGYEIPVKTKVMINVWAIGRDPDVWDDAESFKPERFENSSIDFLGNNFEFLPFGAGRRMCPGIPFGIAVVEITLAKLLYHFNWQLPHEMKPEDMDMNECSGSIARRKNHLFVVPTSPYGTFH